MSYQTGLCQSGLVGWGAGEQGHIKFGYTLNGQTLLEFSHSQDMEGGGTSSELRIRVATLWVRIEFRTGLSRAYRRIQPDRNLTMWVFKVNRQLHANATLLRGKIMQTV
uniref:Uncharacterized protein n=1 Tax=Timema monikensis TaxID=170555 RepID=A0A7R9ED70_9NEOP|nr:unnamed protein product [Timema monikensis]